MRFSAAIESRLTKFALKPWLIVHSVVFLGKMALEKKDRPRLTRCARI